MRHEACSTSAVVVSTSAQPTFRARYLAEQRVAAERAAKVTAACALTLVPFFTYLDSILFPEYEPLFLYWRLATLALAGGVLLLLLAGIGRRHALVLGVLVPTTIGLDVDAMTTLAGREASPYYAGVIVVLLAASLLLPWPPSWAFVTSALLVGGYVGGILAMGPVHDVPLFVTNVLLLASSAVLVVIGSAMAERTRRRDCDGRMLLQAQTRRQEAIARLGQLALSAVGSAELIGRAATLVAETLEVEMSELLELAADWRTLHRRSGCGTIATDAAIVPATLDSHAALALRSATPVVFAELHEDPRLAHAAILRRHGVASGIVCVVGGRDRAFGILGVYAGRPRAFPQEEVEFVQAVAAILTTAIVREQAERALTEEVETSAALARVGRELISSLEAPVLMQRLCELTADVLGADYSNTWLRTVEDDAYVPIAGHGLPAEQWEALRSIKLPAQTVAAFIAHVERDDVVYLRPTDETYPLLARIVAHHGARLAGCIGFRSGGAVVGVQVFGFRQRAVELGGQAARLARGIGQLASMALTNARLVEELERASRLKSDFVSTMSHELRTPLNVIIGYTDMLDDAELEPADRRHALAQVRRSSLELLELIEATLDLNRIAAGKDVLHVERVDVAALFEELRSDFGRIHRDPAVALQWDAAPIAIESDRRKLKIVLKNLVGNALKFTHAGSVVATCRSDGARCTLAVRDTGIGIPPQHLPLIFEMFQQVDSSDARSYNGAGLGLHIVRSILDQLGGAIDVESKPSEGSTFTVRLPLAIAATTRAA